jgi:hypothetical protein
MRIQEIRNCLEKVHNDVARMVEDASANRFALRDRIRWLTMFDSLDDLKEDLLQGHGHSWPPATRDVYVKVRSGVKEVFEILFGKGHESPTIDEPFDAYCIDRLNEYRNRLAVAISCISPVDSSSSTM